jgi:hypothetical protein
MVCADAILAARVKAVSRLAIFFIVDVLRKPYRSLPDAGRPIKAAGRVEICKTDFGYNPVSAIHAPNFECIKDVFLWANLQP